MNKMSSSASFTCAFCLLIFQVSDMRYKAVRTENTHLKGMMGDLDPARYLVMLWIPSPKLNRRGLSGRGWSLGVAPGHVPSSWALPSSHGSPRPGYLLGAWFWPLPRHADHAISWLLILKPHILGGPTSVPTLCSVKPSPQTWIKTIRSDLAWFVFASDLFCGLPLSTGWQGGSCHDQQLRTSGTKQVFSDC